VPEIIPLFPTPFMRVAGAIAPNRVIALRERFAPEAAQANPRSTELTHTTILPPSGDPLLKALAETVQPSLVAFGVHLFGEELTWQIKELWVNVLRHGGRQSVHNHANCFISGVLYLSECHPSANTLFIRSLGGRDFVFSNMHDKTQLGPYNAEKWMGPLPGPGDLVLFPSSLLHEVPVNQGATRVTLAFNAIPHRLDSWGYSIQFSG
jgi:hypothetical protein